MSKLRDAWGNHNVYDDGWYVLMEAAITETEAELTALRQSAKTSAMVAEQAVADLKAARADIARLTRERDEARNKALDEAADCLRKRSNDVSRDNSDRFAYGNAALAILAFKTKDPTNG